MATIQTPIKKVALAGATGFIGGPMLSALREAGFVVTALTREGSSSTFPADVHVKRVDYSSLESVTAALQGQDAFVSTITTSAVQSGTLLADAAIAAGVRRYLPSEFGSESSGAQMESLPLYTAKNAVAAHVRAACAGTATSYTLVYNQMFLDWGLDFSFVLDLAHKKATLFDGGAVPITVTPTDFVGRGVVAILRNLDATANRVVRLHGALVTQTQLLRLAQKYVGADGWEISQASTADELRAAMAAYEKNPGDIMGWVLGMLRRVVWGEGFSTPYTDNNDNALLGLKELSEAEVEEYVKRAVDKAAGKKAETA